MSTATIKLVCSRNMAGMDCTDPNCRKAHFELCRRCSMPIKEEDLEMTGQFQDVPMHRACAERRYPRG